MRQFWSKLNRTKKLEADMMDTKLSRCLNTFDIALLGIGHMVGAGIYVLTGEVAKNVAGPGILISFLIAGFTSLLAALCYAEFGARVPKAGSAYVYTYVTIGEFWAFVIGWNVVLEHLVGTASVARAWSGYLDSLLGGVIRNGTLSHVGAIHTDFFGRYPDFVASAVVLVMGGLLAVGVKGSSYVNSLFTLVNMTVVAFVICFGLYWADIRNWTDFGGFLPFGFRGVITGAATCFYAYVGFDSIATSGEEAKNPAKSIPRATIIAMAAVTTAYIGVSSTLTLMVPYSEINAESALPEAFAANGANWAKYLVAIGAMSGMTTTLFGGLFALPRCFYAMSCDGLFFAAFSRVNAWTQTPIINLLSCSALIALIALLFDIEKLVEFMSIGTLAAYTIVSSSVIILRYQPHSKYNAEVEGIGVGSMESLATDAQQLITVPDDAGKLKQRWSFLEILFDGDPGFVVTMAVLLMTTFMLGFWGLVIWAAEELYSATWWAILLLLLLSGCIVICFVVICFHQQSKGLIHFAVPWVPAIPSLSIFFNTCLMCHLHYLTWIRFTIWMAIGISIYFLYGIRHSKENDRHEPFSALTDSSEAQKLAWGTMQETIHCPQISSKNKLHDEEQSPMLDDSEQ